MAIYSVSSVYTICAIRTIGSSRANEGSSSTPNPSSFRTEISICSCVDIDIAIRSLCVIGVSVATENSVAVLAVYSIGSIYTISSVSTIGPSRANERSSAPPSPSSFRSEISICSCVDVDITIRSLRIIWISIATKNSVTVLTIYSIGSIYTISSVSTIGPNRANERSSGTPNPSSFRTEISIGSCIDIDVSIRSLCIIWVGVTTKNSVTVLAIYSIGSIYAISSVSTIGSSRTNEGDSGTPNPSSFRAEIGICSCIDVDVSILSLRIIWVSVAAENSVSVLAICSVGSVYTIDAICAIRTIGPSRANEGSSGTPNPSSFRSEISICSCVDVDVAIRSLRIIWVGVATKNSVTVLAVSTVYSICAISTLISL